jgi:hypothetical protein
LPGVNHVAEKRHVVARQAARGLTDIFRISVRPYIYIVAAMSNFTAHGFEGS